MIQTSSVGPVHETDQRLELLTARSEPSRRRLAERAAGVAVRRDCTITTTAPERQDFAHRRVKFTSTGVEIGGHVRPPPWSTKDMNNADFDTLLMTPRPPTPPNDAASQPCRTPPNPRRGPPTGHKPPLKHHSTAPGAAPSLIANIRNLPDLQGIPRQSRASSGHFRRAAPRDGFVLAASRRSVSAPSHHRTDPSATSSVRACRELRVSSNSDRQTRNL